MTAVQRNTSGPPKDMPEVFRFYAASLLRIGAGGRLAMNARMLSAGIRVRPSHCRA